MIQEVQPYESLPIYFNTGRKGGKEIGKERKGKERKGKERGEKREERNERRETRGEKCLVLKKVDS